MPRQILIEVKIKSQKPKLTFNSKNLLEKISGKNCPQGFYNHSALFGSSRKSMIVLLIPIAALICVFD